MNLGKETRVTLSNGITVVNFASKKSFEFQDGSILEEVSEERARRLLCKPVETETDGPKVSTEVVLTYKVTNHLMRELIRLIEDPSVDIILVPMPVVTAITNCHGVFPKVCKIMPEEDGRLSIDRFYRYRGE